jgi:hypothetical protein
MSKLSADVGPGARNERNFGISSMLQTLAELRSKMTGESEFFPTLTEKKELVETCSALTVFLHDNKVSNLVLVDRSARPAYLGVSHLWRKNYPDEQIPAIYFVNPDSLKSGEDLFQSGSSGLPKFIEMTFKDDEPPLIQQRIIDQMGKSNDDISTEFSDAYPKLKSNNDQSVLVFDACIHSGDTIKPIKRTLEDIGYKKVLTGVVGNPRDESDLKLDFVALTTEPLGFCRPFDKDRIIKKQLGNILPVKNTNKNEVDRSVRIRKEIISIFKQAPSDWEVNPTEVAQRINLLRKLESRKKTQVQEKTEIFRFDMPSSPKYDDQLPKLESWGTHDNPKKVVTYHIGGERYILDKTDERKLMIVKDGRGVKPTQSHLEKLRTAIAQTPDAEIKKYYDSLGLENID